MIQNKGKTLLGGSAPLLLSSILRSPLKNGGDLPRSNTIVGVTSPAPPFMGGGLESIHFPASRHPKKERENIKFVF